MSLGELLHLAAACITYISAATFSGAVLYHFITDK